MHQKTFDYYNNNAEVYFNETKDAFVLPCMKAFLLSVKEGGSILDLGCGSGRDSRYFLEKGYRVTSIDGSRELARLASSYIGQPVILSDFLTYEPKGKFDGVWAQASLVHLEKEEIAFMLDRISSWLTASGCAALSFRYGDFVGMKDGRFYTYLTEESFRNLLEGSGLVLVSSYLSEDVRPGFSNTWLNLMLKKE